jgi:NTP pyrophosphatase (non-canonical NTP hydrolase)
LTEEQLEQVREEIADVLLYLVCLADKFDVDLIDVATSKIKLNAQKYPVDKSRGTSKKYTKL